MPVAHETTHEAHTVASTDQLANAIVRSVMDRHGVSQDQLALLAQRSRSYINRVTNGQHPVTADILRALWRQTRDAEIAAYLIGEDGTMTVAIRGAPADPLPPLMDAVSGMVRADTTEHQARRAEIALRALARYRLSLGIDQIAAGIDTTA